MKQNIIRSLMAVTFIAILLLAGCQKDTVTLRIRINNFGADGKVYIDGRLPRWSSTDELWVNGQGGYQLSLTNSGASVSVPNTPTYRAIYPSDIVIPANNNNNQNENAITIQLPRVQIYEEVGGNQVVKAPMGGFASSGGIGSSVPMTFNNLGALLAINIQNNLRDGITTLVIDDVVVSSADKTLPLWGNATISDISNPEAYYICDQPDPTDPDRDDYYSVTLARANNAPLCSEFTVNSTMQVYIYVPSHGTFNNRYSITVHAHRGNDEYNQTKTQSSSQGGNLERSQMASVDFPMRAIEAPTGAVQGGTFTVGMDGSTPRKVYFAAGNLQYQANPGTWRIAEHQWDYVGGRTSSNTSFGGNVTGSSNNYISDNYSGWIDLFGWGTSGFDNTANDPEAINFQPYCYVKTNNTTSEVNRTGYGPSIDRSLVITGTTYGNYDWGIYHSNPLTGFNPNGGIKYVVYVNNEAVLEYAGPGSTWRILSTEEWTYLLNSRSFKGQHSGLHYSYSGVTYNGVDGILIYPDNYTDQLTQTNAPHYDFPANSSLPSGCVFLPESGQRDGQFMSTGAKGFYWTSNGSTSTKGQKAFPLVINANSGEAASIDLSHDYPRYYGYAVRLVTPVQ